MSAFGQTQLVNSFETSADMAGIVVRDATATQTQTWATDGMSALKIGFNPVAWPVVADRLSAPQNWSGEGGVAFDAIDLSNSPLYLGFALYSAPVISGNDYGWGGAYTIPSGKTMTLYMPFTGTPNPMTYGMRVLPPPVRHAFKIGWTPAADFDLSHIYTLNFNTHAPSTTVSVAVDNVRLTEPFSQSSLSGIIDAFGQFSKWDWPGKLVSTADFGLRASEEAGSLAAHPGATDRDRWGGWTTGPKLTGTGYFRTTQYGGKWWLVDPDGYLFFSAGVDVVDGSDLANATFTQNREYMFQSLPAIGAPLSNHYVTATAYQGPISSGTAYSYYTANLERKYGSNYMTSWRNTTTARLKSWGFNTLGNWSDDAYCRSRTLPYTAPLSYPSTHAHVPTNGIIWSPMDDPFDPKFQTDVANSFAGRITPYKTDPYCIGYFVDNELSWTGSGTNARYGLAIGALGLNATSSPAKQEFLRELQSKYGTIGNFNAAWKTTFTAWSGLNNPYTPPSTLNSAMTTDMGQFVLKFAQQYFRIISAQIKQQDPNHLYLGCRFSSFTPEVTTAAAQFCDVVSFNVYATQLSATNWGFLTGLGKPCVISEFNSGATDRGPIAASLVDAIDQNGRAANYQSFVQSVLANTALVGFHWYKYVDEPITGTVFNGENFNSGLVDVTDTPYPELVSMAQQMNYQIYAVRGVSK
jgi:hypothetical protein